MKYLLVCALGDRRELPVETGQKECYMLQSDALCAMF